MIDWTRGMAQTFEFREVDPATWQDARPLACITSAEMEFDSESDTGGRATFESSEDLGERYVRAYLVAQQDGSAPERVPLGTFLTQTSSKDADGAFSRYRLEAYTPLLELSDDMPPLGFSVPAGSDSVTAAADLAALHCRAPVAASPVSQALSEPFSAEPDETWLQFLSALLAKAGLSLAPDAMGRICMVPRRDPGSIAPVRGFRDDESSVMCADVSETRDLYGVPNTVEVVLPGEASGTSARAVCGDAGNPASTVARGRTVLARDTSPDAPDGLGGAAAEAWLAEEARRQLAEKCSASREAVYTRGFDPAVRVGDCVALDIAAAGVRVRAVVTRQRVVLGEGCLVEETARWAEVSA